MQLTHSSGEEQARTQSSCEEDLETMRNVIPRNESTQGILANADVIIRCGKQNRKYHEAKEIDDSK